MDEEFRPEELSSKEQALLRAFDAMDLGALEQVGEEQSDSFHTDHTDPLNPLAEMASAENEMLSAEEMLILFIGEADEDLQLLRQILQQLEPDDQLDKARLQALQRTAHKIKGTSAAVGFFSLSMIARHLENVAELILPGLIEPLIGLNALVQTIHALELTLDSIVGSSEEDSTPLAQLEEEYQALGILTQVQALSHSGTLAGTSASQERLATTSFMHVDPQRVEHLTLHTERLAELNTPLESAQAEVEKALLELQTAQTRLQRLEVLLASHEFSLTLNRKAEQHGTNEQPSSQLVARILAESEERTGHSMVSATRRKSTSQAGDTVLWDDLEIDRFTERDILMHSLSEAIADVATASSQLNSAFTRLNRVVEKYKHQATHVRDDALLLRLTPISTLWPYIEQAVQMSAEMHQRTIQFEASVNTLEIDQDVLEALKHPLMQLVRICISNSLGAAPALEHSDADADVNDDASGASGASGASRSGHIWLNSQSNDGTVTLEIGFSMPVAGGALNEVQAAIQHLNGTISAGRNAAGGISFYLGLPRTHGATKALLLRIGTQRVATPIMHVHRIIEESWLAQHGLQETIFPLRAIPGFDFQPVEAGDRLLNPSFGPEPFQPVLRPVLLLRTSQLSDRPIAIQVDEVIGTVELIVKPLAPHLQRPGISGTTIDGSGNVILMLDLPELVRRHYSQGVINHARTKDTTGTKDATEQRYSTEQKHSLVLIADDSVYMRQSLRQTLLKEGYRVIDAYDGIRALELLSGQLPDVLLLDVEMPNLNGYDLLSIMHLHPEFVGIKVIMLTSRTSEKHQARAHELGVYGYLTKPCPAELLIETVRLALGLT